MQRTKDTLRIYDFLKFVLFQKRGSLKRLPWYRSSCTQLQHSTFVKIELKDAKMTELVYLFLVLRRNFRLQSLFLVSDESDFLKVVSSLRITIKRRRGLALLLSPVNNLDTTRENFVQLFYSVFSPRRLQLEWYHYKQLVHSGKVERIPNNKQWGRALYAT